jgi:hypothetical protein
LGWGGEEEERTKEENRCESVNHCWNTLICGILEEGVMEK